MEKKALEETRPKKKLNDGIIITGIKIPFFSLVWLLVEIALAAIPASIIIGIIYVALLGAVINP